MDPIQLYQIILKDGDDNPIYASWCSRCGVLVINAAQHRGWHEALGQ